MWSSLQNAKKTAHQELPPLIPATSAQASAQTGEAATAAGVAATAPMVARKAARTLALKAVQKVARRAKAATSAGNATPKDVLKVSARTAPWVKTVNRAVKAAISHAVMSTSHVLMSAWTPALKAGKKANPARTPVSPAPSQAAVAANVPKAVASVVSRALTPANPVVNVLSVTPSNRTWRWPTKRPWRPR